MEWKKKGRIMWGIYCAGVAMTLGGYFIGLAFPVIGLVVLVTGVVMLIGSMVICMTDKIKQI
jgi:hypothetical protein